MEETISSSTRAMTIPSCCFAKGIARCLKVGWIASERSVIRPSLGLHEGRRFYNGILGGVIPGQSCSNPAPREGR